MHIYLLVTHKRLWNNISQWSRSATKTTKDVFFLFWNNKRKIILFLGISRVLCCLFIMHSFCFYILKEKTRMKNYRNEFPLTTNNDCVFNVVCMWCKKEWFYFSLHSSDASALFSSFIFCFWEQVKSSENFSWVYFFCFW